MKPTIFNADYLLSPNLMDFNRPVEIHTTRFHKNRFPLYRYQNTEGYTIPFDNPNAYKVLLVSNEPICSPNKETIPDIIKYSNYYDLILCTDEEILTKCDNAYLFPYGSTWLNKTELTHADSLGVYVEGLEEKYQNKSFNVSFMATGHRGMVGYDLRQNVWNNKHRLKTPTVFWSSSRTPTNVNGFSNTLHDGYVPNGEKDNLFLSQFTIVIENCVQANYFSEKLIDALITKTVPIYFGCPNIDEFFNTSGMIVVNSLEELIQAVNKLTPDTYVSMQNTINENFNTAKEYAKSFSKRVEESIKDKIQPSQRLFSIGVLTLNGREQYLNRLLSHLESIIPPQYKDLIEIIVNKDNKEKLVGTKRNEVLAAANGKYVAFIDDDDMVSPDYFTSIIPELQKDVDCVGFKGNYYVKGNLILEFHHANSNGGHVRKGWIQYRPINHLNPVKTEIARQIMYPDKNLSEDSDYCDRLFAAKLIKTESVLEEVLYHYYFDPDVTQTQQEYFIK